MLISSRLGPCWRGNATMGELSKQSTGFLVLLLFLSLGHRPEQHSNIHNKYSLLVSASKRKNIASSQTSWLTWRALTPIALCMGRGTAECHCPCVLQHHAEQRHGRALLVRVSPASPTALGRNVPLDQIPKTEPLSQVRRAQQRPERTYCMQITTSTPNLAVGCCAIHLLTHAVIFNRKSVLFWLKHSDCIQ